ncbi:Toluate 1,2-dioxygenase electron transfer component [Folsomia candida]|uniref:Toluate 1,2-dioxygenase electron transfer component n=1 Tax=Folsomia candida TaxID=158441 RepID=A0A226DXS4_FOLCA|nr:Toluate 1,2-dioxygenase electron transfer component [Folsomia candida]
MASNRFTLFAFRGEDHAVLKKFCGDTRFYKAEDDKFVLSERNRLLVRFTTTEPSKPVNDTMTRVGFKLVWSDVEYLTPDNCTKSSRFACQETQVCLTPHHKGASSCPDLKHYCISSSLVCDGLANCGEFDSSDERHCSKTPLVLTVVAIPLGILTTCLFFCFLCYKRRSRKRERRPSNLNGNIRKNNKNVTISSATNGGGGGGGGGCCCCSRLCFCCCLKPKRPKTQESERDQDKKCRPGGFGMGEEAPITRGPIYFKNDLESPNASDIVSPASGFSDSESDIGNQAPIFCPAHGPVHFVPLRYLSRHFPLLPVVQEVTTAGGSGGGGQGSYPNDIYDEGGSLYSTSQNSDMIIYEDNKAGMNHLGLPQQQPGDNHQGSSSFGMNHIMMNKQAQQSNPNSGMSLGFVQEWRMKQLRRVQRSDAVYMSDDNKSSIASSPGATGRICPRCLEKERSSASEPPSSHNQKTGSSTLTSCLLEKQSSLGPQFDSGIDVVDSIMTEPVKNVSFETCTSSDSAISQGFHHHHYRPRLFGGWMKDKSVCCPPPMVEEVTQTDLPPHGMMRNNGDEMRERCGQGGVFCETVTTFGVHTPELSGGSGGGGGGHVQSKATDV